MGKLTIMTALTCATALFGAANQLPNPLLSGYTGMNFSRSATELPHVEKMITKMGDRKSVV